MRAGRGHRRHDKYVPQNVFSVADERCNSVTRPASEGNPPQIASDGGIRPSGCGALIRWVGMTRTSSSVSCGRAPLHAQYATTTGEQIGSTPPHGTALYRVVLH